MELISVIVPVYKVEKYLHKCVDSILAQTYTNLEVILVDDGSPDNCGKICDEYAAKDGRVKVIHQENGGLSAARNAGLDIAAGDYIGFVDSDDYIAPDMYEKLYSALTESGSDMAVCDFTKADEYANCIYTPPLPESKVLTGFQALCEHADFDYLQYVVVWNKLFKSSLFESVRFPLNKICEDNYVIHDLIYSSKSVSVITDKLYFYVQRNNGIMGSYVLLPNIKKTDDIEGWICRLRFFISNGLIEYSGKTLNNISRNYLRLFLRFSPKTDYEKKRTKEIRQMIKDIFPLMKSHLSPVDFVCLLSPAAIHFIGLIISKLIAVLLTVEQLFSKYVLINLPNYNNLGDQAIALCEIALLKHPVKIEEIYFKLNSNIYKHISPEKTVIITGGGFMGKLWPELEQKYIQSVIKSLPDNKILIFPQSVTFDLSRDDGRRYFEDMASTYREHKNLTVFVRERKSFDFMKEHLPEIKSFLVPDMVLSLNVPDFRQKRSGVLFCIRKDHEKLNYDFEDVKSMISDIYGTMQFNEADNLIGTRILPFQRKRLVYNRLKIFASSKLVVTDRLHGMIFAAVTGTPCIALDNSNGKVSGVYEWIKGNEYIRFCKNTDEIRQALTALDLDKEYIFNKAAIREAMKPLYEEING